LYRNLTGNNNTATGNGAMFNNLDGSNNTAVGNSALYLPLHGNNCTALGFNANVAFENLTNATVIGYNAVVDASNKVRIGNTSVKSIGGQVGWTNFSDGRIKKDIKEDVPGLAFIKNLRPVTYHFNMAKEQEMLKMKDSLNWEGKDDIEKINFTGLIAQEVEAAAKKINYDFSGVDKTGAIWGLRYSDFVMPLIKAVQELSTENAELKSRLDRIEKLLSAQAQTQTNAAVQTGSGIYARLEQNAPNPFTSETVIKYSLPAKTANAYINFYGGSGTLLKSVKLTAQEDGRINIKSAELPKGIIQYALIVDGKIITTKEMIH
jgi:autotransporter adhesin